MTTACPSCLIVSEDRVEVVADEDHARLRDLLDGELADARCPVCDSPAGGLPLVAVVFRDDATVLYAPGSTGIHPDALSGTHLRAYLAAGAVPRLVRCADAAQLRDRVRGRLVPRLAPVRALIEAAERGEQLSYLAGHWSDFPPAVVAAAGIAATSPDGPLTLDLAPLLGGRTVERALAAVQVQVWRALVTDWSDGRREGHLFADIEAYVCVSVAAVPAAGAAGIGEIFADRDGDPYVLAAVQAAAALAAGMPNPQATAWAGRYFDAEIALRRGPVDPGLRRRAVPAWFAAATIDHAAAWTAVGHRLRLHEGLPDRENALVVQAIAEAAGHPGVPAAVLQQNVVSAYGPPADAQVIVNRALPLGPDTPTPMALAGAEIELRGLPLDRRALLLDEVAELLLKVAPDDTAVIRVWWAQHDLKLGRTDDADRVLAGITAQLPMDDATHARFLGACADVLAGRGRVDEATDRWHEAEAYAVRTGDLRLRYWTRVNIAIRLQETDPDQALDILMDAAYGPDGYGRDHAILGLLAALRRRRGEIRAALDLLAQAERLATGADASRYAEQRRTLLAESARAPVGAPTAAASDPAAAALRAGNRAEFLRLTHDRAIDLHHADAPAAVEAWEQLVRLRAEYGFPDDPQELAEAAYGRLRAGDPDGMRDLLVRLPIALARRYGRAPANVGEPRSLRRPLVEIAGLLADADQPDADDLRLAGELQRDAVGRAQAARRSTALPGGAQEHQPWRGVPDPAIAATGPVAVVEWIQVGDQRLRCLLTRTESGSSRAGWLTQVMNPVPVHKALFSRLDNWMPGRPDPLDDPDWHTVSGHLVEQLSRHLSDGDHIVFLHHEAVANLPWHTAVRERWTVSYAAGWTHLADIVRRPPAPRRRLGLCLVPQAREDADTLAGLTAAHHHLATLDGVAVTTGAPDTNDAARLAQLLADEDAVVLLCHGYHNDDTEDVGFLLAAGGSLPPPESALARRPEHLFLRGDAARLTRTAPAIFTPACSTSRGYGAGLGDRLGLAATLRPGGTVAMVAPPWDVRGADTTPVLTAVVERYLRGEPLAQALRSAASDAAGSGPDWLVWSLALDGDWR